MTIELFIFLFTVGSSAASLLTQALKKAFTNLSSNMLALASAFIVGIFGTVSAYILMDIVIDAKSIVCVPLMCICIAVGSMVGYDKVLQTIGQLKRG